MRKNTLLYLTLAILFGTASCTTLDEPVPMPGGGAPGEEVTAYLPLKIAPLQHVSDAGIPLTRAPLESEGMDTESISNIWIFQFGAAATDDERLLVSPPYHLDQTAIQDAIDDWTQKGGTAYTAHPHIPVPLIESAPGEVHLVAFAANINSKDFNWGMSAVDGQRSTYAELKNNLFLLNGESLSYGSDNKNLLMSGRVYSAITPDIVLDEHPDHPAEGGNNNEEGVPMYRSLARIELNLSVDAGVDFNVLSVQLRNIPQRVDIFDALIARDEDLYTDYSLLYPAMPAELIHYDTICNTTDKAAGLIGSGENSQYVWYMPRNMRGQSYSASPKTKNTFAPQGATYIEVTGANGARNNEGVIYRIYPGLDDVNDHTILGNHVYTVTLNITGDDEELKNDGRVDQYSHVRMDGNNNAFILNPPMEGMGARVFEIPITQVNRYWRQMWDGYGALGENTLKSDSEWQVDLLWQDDAAMVRAVQDTPTRISLTKTEGRGPDADGYFSIAVPHGTVHGNFSLALRKKEAGAVVDNILWSWHFWVTDYNPDQYTSHFVNSRKFVYPVTGGQVERYGGAMWGYDTDKATLSNNWNNYAFNPATTKPYRQTFMMDRNLGALHTGNTSSREKGNITYQWGRKDPFPPVITLYDINGNAIKTTASTGFQAQRWNSSVANGSTSDAKVAMSQSIADPMKYYYSKTGNWCSELDGSNTYAWNDPQTRAGHYSEKIGYEGKSIYDPCPPGWKLPTQLVWEDYRRSDLYGWTVNNGNHNRGDAFGTFQEGIRYWPNVATADGAYPVDGTIFLPASGYRRSNGTSSYGHFYKNGTEGLCWSATSLSEGTAYSLNYLSSKTVLSSADKNYACPARCMSIDE